MGNHAAGQAPDGRVLITAARRGGRVQISVTDGGAGADRVGVSATLRDTESLIAMQGGTFEIVARPAEGTTLVARWPDASRDAKPQNLAAPPDAAVRGSSSTHASHSVFSN